jgi:long-chain fatty acid transport protein
MPLSRSPNPLPAFQLALFTLLLPSVALAGGLALPGHGVRSFARAGAFTAGGDDPSGIWQNPANIGGLDGIRVVLDGALIFSRIRYTRVDSGGNLLREVQGEGPLIPVPTAAISFPAIKDRLWLGFAFSAPYSPVLAYPAPSYAPCAPERPSGCLDTVHADAPQRYSVISQDGTRFVQIDLAAAVRILPSLTIGISLQNMFVQFVTLSSITSYNGALSSGPEDPDFDSLTETRMLRLFNPSAKLGLIWQPHPRVRVGASFQLPFWIRGDAEINVQLPVSPLYEKASVEGKQARLELTLPFVLRTGIEVRPIPSLRIELGVDYDQWSLLEAIRVFPQDIYILNIPSIDRYKVPDLAIGVNMRDTFTLRLGGEYTLSRLPLTLRLGYIFDLGASEDAYASALSLDDNKHVLTLGVGYNLRGYQVDLTFAQSFTGTRSVDFRESKSMQINPINPSGAVAIGGGSYSSTFSLLGLAVGKTF